MVLLLLSPPFVVLATLLCLASLSSQSPLPANTSKASPWANQRPAPPQRNLRERNGDAQYIIYSDDSSASSSNSEYQPTSSSSVRSGSSLGKIDDVSFSQRDQAQSPPGHPRSFHSSPSRSVSPPRRAAFPVEVGSPMRSLSTERPSASPLQRSSSPSSSRGYSMSPDSSMTTPLDIPWQWSRAHPAGAISPNFAPLYPGSPVEYTGWNENHFAAPEASQDRLLRELVHTSHSSQGASGSEGEPEIQSIKPDRRRIMHLDELRDLNADAGEKSESSWSASKSASSSSSSSWHQSVESRRRRTRGMRGSRDPRVSSGQRRIRPSDGEEKGKKYAAERCGSAKVGARKRKQRLVVSSSSDESYIPALEQDPNAASTSRRRQKQPRKYTKGSRPHGKQ